MLAGERSRLAVAHAAGLEAHHHAHRQERHQRQPVLGVVHGQRVVGGQEEEVPGKEGQHRRQHRRPGAAGAGHQDHEQKVQQRPLAFGERIATGQKGRRREGDRQDGQKIPVAGEVGERAPQHVTSQVSRRVVETRLYAAAGGRAGRDAAGAGRYAAGAGRYAPRTRRSTLPSGRPTRTSSAASKNRPCSTTPGSALSAAARAGRPSPPRSASPQSSDEVAFVGDELPAVGAEPQGRRRHELQELPLRLTPAEPHDLDRQRATFAEVPHELVVLDHDEQPGGGAGQQLLAQERAAAALEQVEPGVDLVGAVHDQVEQRRPRAAVDRAAPFEIELVEGDDGKARRARQAVGLRRGGHAEQRRALGPALRGELDDRRDGAPRAETDRRTRREALGRGARGGRSRGRRARRGLGRGRVGSSRRSVVSAHLHRSCIPATACGRPRRA